MAKTIIKEIFIILLVCIAIVLVMALVFYEYVPSNKSIPAKVEAYKTPANIQTEITENTIESYTTQEHDYTIENTDLSKYQASQSYNPGKANPFEEYSDSTNGGNTGTENKVQNNNVDKNVTDNYYTSQNVESGTK